jgi:hypothetical protein
LRYFDALKTDHYELELGNANFAINAWSKLAIDAVAALDVQEYDTTTFGVLEVSICVYVQLLHAVFTRMHVLLCIFFLHCICHFICFQLKDEYKDVGALEMGLFGGPNGFNSWMKLNTHPSCTQKVANCEHALFAVFVLFAKGDAG